MTSLSASMLWALGVLLAFFGPDFWSRVSECGSMVLARSIRQIRNILHGFWDIHSNTYKPLTSKHPASTRPLAPFRIFYSLLRLLQTNEASTSSTEVDGRRATTLDSQKSRRGRGTSGGRDKEGTQGCGSTTGYGAGKTCVGA